MTVNFDPNDLQAQQPTYSFDPQQKVVPDAVSENRAAKYDFALNDASPGLPAVLSDIQTTGGDYMKKLQMESNNIKFEQQKNQMIQNMLDTQKGNVTPDEASFVYGISQQDLKENPQNVMETSYAKRFMQTIADRDQNQAFPKAEG